MFLKNGSQRAYTLPGREGPRGAKFGGGGLTLRPGAALEAPPWYVDELAKEKGFKVLLERGELVVEAEGGSIRRSPAPVDARVTELETQLAAARDRAKDIETRARTALAERDARIAELEAQVKTSDAKPGDTKSEAKNEGEPRSGRR